MKYVHGEFRVSCCGNIVVTHAYGPWNQECVNNFASEYRTKSVGLLNSPWSDIVVVVGESLLVPDAERLLREKVKAASSVGLSHVALVLGESTVRTTTKAQLDNVYQGLNVHYECFDTLEEAMKWLQQFSYALDVSALEAHFQQLPSS